MTIQENTTTFLALMLQAIEANRPHVAKQCAQYLVRPVLDTMRDRQYLVRTTLPGTAKYSPVQTGRGVEV